MATVFLPKARRIWQEVYCTPVSTMQIWTTPYEPSLGTISGGANPINYFTVQDDDLAITTDYRFKSYRSPTPGVGSRIDMKLLSITMDSTGGEAEFEIRGQRYLQMGLQGGRGIAVWFADWIDDPTGGSHQACWTSSQVGLFFIDPDGGIVNTRREKGEIVTTIRAVTPDRFLSKYNILKLPYLLKSIVDSERASWSSRARTDTALGFTPSGSGAFTADPFSGFANYVDVFTSPPSAILSPRPANEAHFLANCGVQYALEEMMTNHVLVNMAGGVKSMKDSFNIHMDLTGAENQVVSCEIGPGSVWDAVLESAKHGMFKTWFDAKSAMWYQPDYCTLYPGAIHPSMVIRNGKSMVGELKVNLGPMFRRINRAAVQGLWSANTQGAGDGPQNYFSTGLGAGLFPIGQTTGNPGTDVTMDGYIGLNVADMAKSLFSKSCEKTTFSLTDFPFAADALALFNRVVCIDMQDPLQEWDFRAGQASAIGLDVGQLGAGGNYGSDGKPFCVNQVSVQNIDPEAPGFGTFTASLGGTEIIPRCG